MLLSGHRYLGSPDPGHTHQSPDVRRIQTGNDEPGTDVARDAERRWWGSWQMSSLSAINILTPLSDEVLLRPIITVASFVPRGGEGQLKLFPDLDTKNISLWIIVLLKVPLRPTYDHWNSYNSWFSMRANEFNVSFCFRGLKGYRKEKIIFTNYNI